MRFKKRGKKLISLLSLGKYSVTLQGCRLQKLRIWSDLVCELLLTSCHVQIKVVKCMHTRHRWHRWAREISLQSSPWPPPHQPFTVNPKTFLMASLATVFVKHILGENKMKQNMQTNKQKTKPKQKSWTLVFIFWRWKNQNQTKQMKTYQNIPKRYNSNQAVVLPITVRTSHK